MLAAISSAPVFGETVTLTMDELPFQPVHGLSYRGVQFDFRLNGEPSFDANYHSGGPGSVYYVEDPSLEGNGRGILTLSFDQPTPLLEFGFAKSTFQALNPGIAVELFDAGLNSLGVFPNPSQPLITFTEGFFSYRDSLVSKAVIDFSVNPEDLAARFAVDNLRYSTDAEIKPGSTPLLPLPPSGNSGEGFGFDIIVVDPQEIVFIDPPVAVGYEYAASGGPNFASVQVPLVLPNGDAEFLLEVGGGTYNLVAGTPFNLLGLNPGGFSEFRILGIDTAEMLDPNDPFAFVTGLTFTGPGNVVVTQSPITVNVDIVPEGDLVWTVGLAVAGIAGWQWRRSRRG